MEALLHGEYVTPEGVRRKFAGVRAPRMSRRRFTRPDVYNMLQGYVSDALKNGRNVVVAGPRQSGRTTIVKKAVTDIPRLSWFMCGTFRGRTRSERASRDAPVVSIYDNHDFALKSHAAQTDAVGVTSVHVLLDKQLSVWWEE